MKIKDLFTVPEGEKVTEKHLRRVLISSICSILLCMTCLVSTTWAWFAVDIENPNNVIHIASARESVQISPDPTVTEDGVYILNAGEYTVAVTVSSYEAEADDFGSKGKMYVRMSAAVSGGEESVAWFEFSANGTQEVTLKILQETTLSFDPVSWVPPATEDRVGETLTIGETTPETTTDPLTDPEPTEPASEPTEPSSEPASTPTTGETEPPETTDDANSEGD